MHQGGVQPARRAAPGHDVRYRRYAEASVGARIHRHQEGVREVRRELQQVRQERPAVAEKKALGNAAEAARPSTRENGERDIRIPLASLGDAIHPHALP